MRLSRLLGVAVELREPFGQLVGVLAFGVPMSNKVLTSVFPALTLLCTKQAGAPCGCADSRP
jgi:hypothetical protein